MRRFQLQASALYAAACLPTVALAHPGHDHSHWSSSAIHAALYLAIMALSSAGLVWAGVRLHRQRARLRLRIRSRD